MELERQYREIVNSTAPSLPSSPVALEGLYKHYSLKETSFYSRNDVPDFLLNSAKRLLSINGSLKTKDLRKLQDQLLLKYLIEKEILQPHFNILDKISSFTKELPEKIISFNENIVSWKQAISFIKDYLILENHSLTDAEDLTNIKMMNSRVLSLGHQIKVLRTYKFLVDIDDGLPKCELAEVERIRNSIDIRIKQLGGIPVAQNIFRNLLPVFDEDQYRYHLVRKLNQYTQMPEASIPYGYILNLCTKHNYTSNKILNTPKKYKSIIELSTALTALYDIQAYTNWELIFNHADSFPHFLQKIALYDSVFTIPQTRPTDIPLILHGLFNWVDSKKLKNQEGWGVEEAIKFCDVLICRTLHCRGPVQIDIKDLREQLFYPDSLFNQLLEIFTHDGKSVNTSYKTPHESGNKNFGYKPLIRNSKDQIILMDISWCSPSFFEAIAHKLLEDFDKKTYEKIGLALEDTVKAIFSKHGITYHFGKYKVKKQEGECDLVIESDDTIVFIEMKKQVLSHQARAGDDITIFENLSRSLFHSQKQLGQHEILLRKNGFIPIVTDGIEYKLEWNDRKIERVTLTLKDFGGFQDPILLRQLLSFVLRSDISAKSEPSENKLVSLKKYTKELRKQHEELIGLGIEPLQNMYMHCRFLSLPQLLVVLDGVNSNNSFVKSLNSTKHVSVGTMDFYHLHSYAEKLKNQGGSDKGNTQQ